MKVLGVDSSTKTGLCVLEEDEYFVKLLQVKDTSGFERLQLIANNFGNFLDARQPEVAFIEEYALGMKKSGDTIITQIEIGTVLRMELAERGIPWRTIRPNSAKLWLGGKGNGSMKKDMVAKYVWDRWYFRNDDDNITDAYMLARMGQWLMATEVEKYPPGVNYGHGALNFAV